MWLFAQAAKAAASAGGGGLTGEQLALALLAAFHAHSSGRGEDETRLQTALFELLGEAHFDLMATLMDHRQAVAAMSTADLRRVATVLTSQASVAAGGAGGGGGGGAPAGPRSVAPSVVVTTTAGMREWKERRRAERKAGRQHAALAGIQERLAEEMGAGAGGAADALVAAGFSPSMLATERTLGLPAARAGSDRRGYLSVEAAIAAVGAGHGADPRRMLPEGTVETNHDGYKQVAVPPARAAGSGGGGAAGAPRLVAVADLHPVAQAAFRGITRLNRLQSELFEAAYSTAENLLVCAPTGAGKTNVAMLTVCQQLLGCLTPDGRVRKEDVKIIYVAPMKALAQEVVAKFSERLASLGLRVRELTGDMQLTKREIAETQLIVTTPEKWDVITRKAGDGSLVSQVRLLIIDEVHLLADTRGAVIESIVARTLRLVESSQCAVRIVGLSATLPNYQDVALFLRVNPSTGLFYFNDAYRPVPLAQTFIGVTENNAARRTNMMNKIAYDKAMAAIRRGKQVMIFVHSRKDTAKTAAALLELARADSALALLSPFSGEEAEDADAGAGGSWRGAGGGGAAAGGGATAVRGEGRVTLSQTEWLALQRDVERSRNRELRELFKDGIGIHHAGMLRADRGIAERSFAAGVTKILVCTATLAWGVNLPAHTVIIKGTQIYNAEAGGFTDVGMLDVMQIFGRAGRPQFDTSGEGIIITAHDKLQFYLQMLTHTVPIESSFIKALPDHLNAEVVSGTVTNLREAVSWLSYTYLFIRMLRNPMAYGVGWEELHADTMLERKRLDLIRTAAKALDACHMMRFDDASGNLAVTDLGRVASHYYITHTTIETFNAVLDKPTAPALSDADALDLLCLADEFKNVRVRDEELPELDMLRSMARVPVKGDAAHTPAKVNILLQAHISQLAVHSFTLVSDTAYVTQSAGRIARALFEIFLRKGWVTSAERLLTISKAVDRRLWWGASPLWQLRDVALNAEEIRRLEETGTPLDDLCDLSAGDLGSLVRHPKNGGRVAAALASLPHLEVEAAVQPVTRSIMRVTLRLWPTFKWVDRLHGTAEPWYVWVEDATNEHIYHSESLLVDRRAVAAAAAGEPITLTFAIPIFEPLPSQYWVRAVSDRWLGMQTLTPISFRHLVLPERAPPHTDLLDLAPLPRAALGDARLEALYRFSHFNPVQTQMFHAVYHTDAPILLGAPTGSGKTVAAELAVYRLWAAHPGKKAVYVAPLKALVAERLKDWTAKFGGLGRRVVELTGDFTPDVAALRAADVLITTPEKWDSISRSWRRRNYVAAVGLVILDEIHLLGEDRGPVLEVIVSRMRYIAAETGAPVRFVGLSTALANAGDLADWLGITGAGLYNFRPSVRPIPMEVHIQGFPGKHYCPRMATMNKPAYAAIKAYSPDKPVLIFVSSRRQTRLTALDLIALAAGDDAPRRFLRMPEEELEPLVARVKDEALAHTLRFGIGMHHAGLPEGDRTLVEELYENGRIQVLVATSTLAWGVNFPAHLVVVKGTEFFDGKTGRYVDLPLTDVLQMMGRAGRPQFDTHAVAVILVAEPKKNFYRKFLYEPFPVESHLASALAEHLNAEVAGGTIVSRHDAVEYLTWTYYFRRLLQNPAYYGVEDATNAGVQAFLYALVDRLFDELERSGCVARGADALPLLRGAAPPPAAVADALAPTSLGAIASFYYLEHGTMRLLIDRLGDTTEPAALLRLMCDAVEFSELPVRHNEEELNEGLARALPWPARGAYDSPHVKAFLLLQARMAHAPLPITDFISDTKSVLDNTLRMLNAMVDVAADGGYLPQVLHLASLAQCAVTACFPTDSPLWQLRGASEALLAAAATAFPPPAGGAAGAAAGGGVGVRELAARTDDELTRALGSAGDREAVAAFIRHLRSLPVMTWRTAWVAAPGSGVTVHGDTVRVPAAAPPAAGAAAAASGSSVAASVALTVTLRCTNAPPKYAITPYFSRKKEFSWWLVAGDADATELLALKRIPQPDRGAAGVTHTLTLQVPDTPGRLPVDLYLLSDTVRGIDQHVRLYLDVVAPPA